MIVIICSTFVANNLLISNYKIFLDRSTSGVLTLINSLRCSLML